MSARLKNYMKNATAKQRERLANMAGTTQSYLYQIAGGHRRASAGCAGRLERAAKLMSAKERKALGLLPRHLIAPDCADCGRK